ncbi:DUF3168 domain-containing protein [Phyllobacterium lublinensis]|uniref:DUF3168 domain-containing protein n=1 Tax=Phyllobacterium lublinensis TaxID=2875708 RepID=UPI001CC9F493|nr:DUF3168 domain-containing protein [Phyllobacterium sp. 2063]MBZ9653545.1 DUF3168 domain-containing protein [Phyllobacterium sp. 2063]
MTISEEIQKMLLDTLKGDTTLMALVNGVYDSPPTESVRFAAPKEAFISFGPADVVDDFAECIDGETHTIQLDVWSRTVGNIGCKRIVDIVKSILNRADLSLTTNALVQIRTPLVRVFRDPDGLTSHGVVSVEMMVEVA